MNFDPDTPRAVGAAASLDLGGPLDRDHHFPLASVVDLFFIILCLLVVSLAADRREAEVELNLPESDAAPPLRRGLADILVNVSADGHLTLHGQVVNLDELRERVQRATRVLGPQRVLLRADGATSHRRILEVLSICRAAGVRNVSFVTVPREGRHVDGADSPDLASPAGTWDGFQP